MCCMQQVPVLGLTVHTCGPHSHPMCCMQCWVTYIPQAVCNPCCPPMQWCSASSTRSSPHAACRDPQTGSYGSMGLMFVPPGLSNTIGICKICSYSGNGEQLVQRHNSVTRHTGQWPQTGKPLGAAAFPGWHPGWLFQLPNPSYATDSWNFQNLPAKTKKISTSRLIAPSKK